MIKQLTESIGKSASSVLGNHLAEARSYDADRQSELEESRAVAWRVAGASLLVAAISCASLPVTLAVLLPLKTTEHIPIVIDNVSGKVERAVPLVKAPKEWPDALVEAQAWRYVFNRESYLRETINRQYGEMKAFSGAEELAAVNREWSVKNPQSPFVRYGTKRVDVARRAIRFQPNNVVVVEFTKTEDVGLTTQRTLTLAATIVYRATNLAPDNEDARNINPLGFYIERYRVTPITEAAAGGPAS